MRLDNKLIPTRTAIRAEIRTESGTAIRTGARAEIYMANRAEIQTATCVHGREAA